MCSGTLLTTRLTIPLFLSLSLVIWQILFYTTGGKKWHYCKLKTQSGTGLPRGSKEDKGGKEQVLLCKLRGQNLLPAAGKGREVGKKQVRNTMGK